MLDPFASAVASWNNFYVLAGGAAATLVGLLFVAVSHHIDLLTDPAATAVVTMARRTFFRFIYIVVISLLFLIPAQTPHDLGLSLLGVGVLDCLSQVRVIVVSRKEWAHLRGLLDSGRGALLSLGLPLVSSLGLLGIAAGLCAGRLGCLRLLVLVIAAFLVSAAKDSWRLLLDLAHSRRRRTLPSAMS